jgi:hypothetical protein
MTHQRGFASMAKLSSSTNTSESFLISTAAKQNHNSQNSSYYKSKLTALVFLSSTAIFAYTNVAFCDSPKNRRSAVTVTDVEAELIARKLRDLCDIPGIPNIIEKPIVEQVIKAFIQVYPLVLPEDVFNKLIAGEGGANGVNEAIIRQINEKIYIPLISKEVQNHIVEQLCIVLFTPAQLGVVKRQMLTRAMRDVMNVENRQIVLHQYADKLNQSIDIPLLSEDHEQHMAEKIVNMCFDVLETFIPQSVRDVLENTSPEELRELRESLSVRLAEKIDIPFANEEEEQRVLKFVVDFFLEYCGLQDGTKTPSEQLNDLEHRLKCLDLELEAYEEISMDKIAKMRLQRKQLYQKKKEIARIVKGKAWYQFWK